MFGVTFDDYHSYDDLNLILESYDIPPAEPKTSFIDLPGGDGSIDVTEALGVILYNTRNASWTFIVEPGRNWTEAESLVSSKINGRKMRIVMDNDIEHYWVGRMTVSSYSSDNSFLRITITAVLEPYKYKDTVISYSIASSRSMEVILHNEFRQALPKFTSTGSLIIRTKKPEETTYKNSFALGKGSDIVFSGLRLDAGDTMMSIQNRSTSSVVLTIKYQEGQL